MMWLIASAVGLFGLAGIATFFGFLPFMAPVFGVVIKVVCDVLGALLKTRVGCSLLTAALVAAVVYPMADVRGRRVVNAQWAAADARQQVAATARDARIAAEARSAANAETAAIKQTSDELATKVADYEKELATRKGPVCVLSPDDVRRLRDIGPGVTKTPSKHL